MAATRRRESVQPEAAKKLGAEALPHLERLIVGDHSMLASKAAYLAGLIGTEKSVPVLERAARSGDAIVRIAAASAVQHLSAESASDVLLSLVDDADVGVQKIALKSVPDNASAVLRSRVEGLSAGKSDNMIRALSREVLSRQSGVESVAQADAKPAKKKGASKGKSKAKKKTGK